jgi:phosphate transport system permease protein
MSNVKRNRNIDTAFKYVGIFFTLFGIAVLFVFIINILIDGLTRIDWEFITNLPSRRASKAGILTAWTGTLDSLQ